MGDKRFVIWQSVFIVSVVFLDLLSGVQDRRSDSVNRYIRVGAMCCADYALFTGDLALPILLQLSGFIRVKYRNMGNVLSDCGLLGRNSLRAV